MLVFIQVHVTEEATLHIIFYRYSIPISYRYCCFHHDCIACMLFRVEHELSEHCYLLIVSDAK